MALRAVVEPLMHAMPEAGISAFSARSPAEARATMDAIRKAAPVRELPTLAEQCDFEIPGDLLVRVRSYTPLGQACGTIVYMRGGGWVIGDLETSHPPAAALAAASRCRVLSVDYRLAPEHRYPATLDDVMQVVAWAAAQGGPVFVSGDKRRQHSRRGGSLAGSRIGRARHRRADSDLPSARSDLGDPTSLPSMGPGVRRWWLIWLPRSNTISLGLRTA